MKPHLIFGGCLAALIIVVGLIWLESEPPVPASSAPPATAHQPKLIPPSTTTDLVKPNFHKPWRELTPEQQNEMMQWRVQQNAKDAFSDWKTHIEFYGFVIDENKQPLPGATATWITTTVSGNDHGSTVSGSDGRFCVDTTGNEIDIVLKKDGYRSVEGPQGFEFARFFEDNYYDHDKDNPVVFHLRKISAYEPIYIWNRGMRRNVVGDKITINPRSGVIEHGELSEGMWFQFIPGPQNGADREQYDIVFGTASGGGVILVTGDADEYAPESSYENPLDSQLMIDFEGDRIIKRKVFFKDGAGHYGSFSFDAKLLAHNVTLTYLLKYNPSGGRSLSAPPQSEFQINKNAY